MKKAVTQIQFMKPIFIHFLAVLVCDINCNLWFPEEYMSKMFNKLLFYNSLDKTNYNNKSLLCDSSNDLDIEEACDRNINIPSFNNN